MLTQKAIWGKMFLWLDVIFNLNKNDEVTVSESIYVWKLDQTIP